MSCAATAAENKASVLVIEANDKVGGKGILAGGNLGIGGGTRMQTALGYVETADIIYQDRTIEAFRTDGADHDGRRRGGRQAHRAPVAQDLGRQRRGRHGSRVRRQQSFHLELA